MGAKGTGFYDTYESELDEEQLKLLEELEREQEALKIKESLSLGELAKIFRIESALQGNPQALQNKTDHDIYNEAEKRNNPLTQKVFKGVLFDKLACFSINSLFILTSLHSSNTACANCFICFCCSSSMSSMSNYV